MTQSTHPFEIVTGFMKTLDEFTKGNVSSEKLFPKAAGPKYVRADEVHPGMMLVTEGAESVRVNGVELDGDHRRVFYIRNDAALTVLNNMKVEVDG